VRIALSMLGVTRLKSVVVEAFWFSPQNELNTLKFNFKAKTCAKNTTAVIAYRHYALSSCSSLSWIQAP
jgi:hypothetical protein